MRPSREEPHGPEGPVIFLHIPKTAGTSLRQTMSEVYRQERCLFVYEPDFVDDPAQAAALRESVDRIDLVFGHMSFGAHEALGLEANYVTVVREPIARVVSFYRHQAREPESEFHDRIAAGMTMLDLLRSEECHQVNNHMTRILRGRDTDGMVFDHGQLALALANLDAYFLAVGVTEHMARSMERMGRALGWRVSPSVPSLNVDPDPTIGPLDEETRAEILRYNELDVALYDRVMGDLVG